MTFTVILDNKDFQSFFFFKLTCKEKIGVSSVIAMHLASCLQLPRAWSAFYLRPYLELLLLFLLALEAAVSSSDVCRFPPGRKPSVLAGEVGGGGGGGGGGVRRCISRLSLQSSLLTSRWRSCKGYKTPSLFPSPPLPFPSLFSRRLFPLNAFQAVSTLWSS